MGSSSDCGIVFVEPQESAGAISDGCSNELGGSQESTSNGGSLGTEATTESGSAESISVSSLSNDCAPEVNDCIISEISVLHPQRSLINNTDGSTMDTSTSSPRFDFKNAHCTSDSTSTPNNSKSKHRVGFNPNWKVERPWLKTEVCENEEGLKVLGMYCQLCRDFGMKGARGCLIWSKIPCVSLRKDKVILHEKSSMHEEAVQLVYARKVDQLATDDEEPRNLMPLVTIMKSLELLIRHNIPHTTFFKPFIEFAIRDLNSPNLTCFDQAGNMKYTSPAIQNEMIEVIAEECKNDLLNQLRESPSASLLIDETADIALRKHLGLAVKFIDNSGDVVTTFLDTVEIGNGTAECIFDNILSVCKKHGIPLNIFKSIGTDGANVMFGCKTGVVTRLRNILPALIAIHCHNHRLALALQDSVTAVPLLSKLIEVIQATFNYYHYSANKSASLRSSQDLLKQLGNLDTAPLTVKGVSFTRWMSHVNAASTMRKIYRAILDDLENAVVLKVGEGSSGPTPDGLLKNLKSFKTYMTLCWFNDILYELSLLTLTLESDSVQIATLLTKLALCKANIKKMQNKPGVFGRKAEKKLGQELGLTPNDEDVKAVYAEFKKWVPQVITCIDERFENQEILLSLASLELSSLQGVPLPAYGDEAIISLCDHFNLDEDMVLQEWSSFKEILQGNQENSNFAVMYKTILNLEKQAVTSFNNIKFLISTAMTLPLSTAVVERIFSNVKNILSEKRSRLDVNRVSDFLCIKFASKIDYKKAALKFLLKKKRRYI